jgi:CO/xanthine dehydrogenase FAD-binding subunit
VAAIVTLDRRGNCERVRVGITGLGAKSFRAKAVERARG